MTLDGEKGAKKRKKKSCCAPGCTSGTVVCADDVTFHSFPKDESRRRLWAQRVPLVNWTPPKDARLCSKHFAEASYRVQRNDGTKSRVEKIGRDLIRSKLLRDDAVPSLWPNCPIYLSKIPPTPRTSVNSSGNRSLVVVDGDEKPGNVEILPSVVILSSLSDLDDLLDTQKLPPSISIISRNT